MALFVFLAGATWTGIVATYLFAGAAGGGAVGVCCGSADGAGLLEFTLLFLVELALESVDGGGRGAVGYGRGLAGSLTVQGSRCPTLFRVAAQGRRGQRNWRRAPGLSLPSFQLLLESAKVRRLAGRAGQGT